MRAFIITGLITVSDSISCVSAVTVALIGVRGVPAGGMCMTSSHSQSTLINIRTGGVGPLSRVSYEPGGGQRTRAGGGVTDSRIITREAPSHRWVVNVSTPAALEILQTLPTGVEPGTIHALRHRVNTVIPVSAVTVRILSEVRSEIEAAPCGLAPCAVAGVREAFRAGPALMTGTGTVLR